MRKAKELNLAILACSVSSHSTSFFTALFVWLVMHHHDLLLGNGVFSEEDLFHHVLPYWKHHIQVIFRKNKFKLHQALNLISSSKPFHTIIADVETSSMSAHLIQGACSGFTSKFGVNIHLCKTLEDLKQYHNNSSTSIVIFQLTTGKCSRVWDLVVTTEDYKNCSFAKVHDIYLNKNKTQVLNNFI